MAPLEELQKKVIMKCFMGYHYFWAMFWDQKASASHIEFSQLIPESKRSDCKIRP